MSILTTLRNLFNTDNTVHRTAVITIEDKEEIRKIEMPEDSAYLFFMLQALDRIKALEEELAFLQIQKDSEDDKKEDSLIITLNADDTHTSK